MSPCMVVCGCVNPQHLFNGTYKSIVLTSDDNSDSLPSTPLYE